MGSDNYDELEGLAELYTQVPLYNARPDVDFYVAEARTTRGDVLELGCGTGRVLLPVARLGKKIAGVDNSSKMLAVCRDRLEREPAEVRDRVTLVQADMRDLNLGRTFSLIM